MEKGDRKEAYEKLNLIKFVIDKVMERFGKEVGLNVIIKSSIPIAAGLGSSAAVAVSVTTAVSELLELGLSREDIFNIAYRGECLIHGNPSGIDPAISTYGGALLFHKSEKPKPIEIKGEIPLVIGNTQIKRSTGKLVAHVNRVRVKYPSIIEPLIGSYKALLHNAVKALKEGDLHTLGELMNLNQGLLYTLGVSSGSLERLINAAREAGALGAKLTGAGGGGCIIALTEPEKLESVSKAIKLAGGTALIVKRSFEGVRIED